MPCRNNLTESPARLAWHSRLFRVPTNDLYDPTWFNLAQAAAFSSLALAEMGSAPSCSHRVGCYCKIDESRNRDFSGCLRFGKITGVCAALQRHNYEYTVQVDSGDTECVEEQYLQELSLPELDWVSPYTREVAVFVETHGAKRFVAELIRRTEDGVFQVRFADGSLLENVKVEQLSPPAENALRTSPSKTPPDADWLLDRKIQARIDDVWPIKRRIKDALEKLRTPRPVTAPILRGPFVGKDAVDSEGEPLPPIHCFRLGILRHGCACLLGSKDARRVLSCHRIALQATLPIRSLRKTWSSTVSS